MMGFRGIRSIWGIYRPEWSPWGPVSPLSPLSHNIVKSRVNSKISTIQTRSIQLSAPQIRAVKGWGLVMNIVAGAYIGGLLVCFGLFYFLYQDANSRQHIPWELRWQDQITTVKAINKDDLLGSPRFAAKHYRRLLIELARQAKKGDSLGFDENFTENKYDVPIIDAETLVYGKSADFANFYIDIVLRYARSLLAKGELDTSVEVLRKIIDVDRLFYLVGDVERLSQCCRLLSKVTPEFSDKIRYLQRSIDLIQNTFSSIYIDENYLVQDNSKITDELILSLDDLAFIYAKASSGARKYDKDQLLTTALNIYLANLKKLTQIKSQLDSPQLQAAYPLFNCDRENIVMTVAEIKAHISEIAWAKGYKKNAVAWSEDVVDEIYFAHATSKRASPILVNVLQNLIQMYNHLGNIKAKNKCSALLSDIKIFQINDGSWYDRTMARLAKIVYNKGPLGVIEKPLLERFGRPLRLPEIEEFEQEDQE